MKKINVYIGYDSRQDRPPKYNKVINPCYEVCKSSILKNSNDVNVIPLKLNELIDKQIYYRDVDPLASTEFTYSRFLVPYLNDFKGIAIFCDSDFLWQCDINDLLEYYNQDKRYEKIANGSKIKWLYLKNNNLGLDTVAYKGYEDPPEIMKFIRETMDIDKIYDQAMTKKIGMFYDSLDWGKPVDKEQTIERFF